MIGFYLMILVTEGISEFFFWWYSLSVPTASLNACDVYSQRFGLSFDCVH